VVECLGVGQKRKKPVAHEDRVHSCAETVYGNEKSIGGGLIGDWLLDACDGGARTNAQEGTYSCFELAEKLRVATNNVETCADAQELTLSGGKPPRGQAKVGGSGVWGVGHRRETSGL
jgi:hypothetical protein